MLWKHSPVHLDLKYAQWLSEGQGQISGRQMQALSPCVTGPLPFCWEINRLTITLFTSVKYGHRGSIYLPNRPLSRTKPCSCLASKSPTYTLFLRSQNLLLNRGEVSWLWKKNPESWLARHCVSPSQSHTHTLGFTSLLHKGTQSLIALMEVSHKQ